MRRRPLGSPAGSLRAAALIALVGPAELGAQRPIAVDTGLVRSESVLIVVDGSTPPATLLYQNFPNPFPAGGQQSTCLWFDLAVAAVVELEILDLRGNAVRRFVPGPEFPGILPTGRYGRGGPGGGGPTCDARLTWDGRADDGRDVPPGVYLYKLKAGGIIQFRRIVFRGRGH